MADAVIEKAIADKQMPGAVLLVGRGSEILYQKAYGMRALVPQAEPMTLDTVFDMASVTKVVATTTSVMILVEEGKIRLNDRVATFIPDFGRYGKGDITIRHLLTHVSGLRPGPRSRATTRGGATTKPSGARARKCPPRRPASASSTATSTSSCSPTSWRAWRHAVRPVRAGARRRAARA